MAQTQETYEEYQSKVGERAVRMVFKFLGDLELVKIPEKKGQRTPDYEVRNSNGDVVAFCEVKSLVDSLTHDSVDGISFEESVELSKKRDKNHRSKLRKHLGTATSQLEKYKHLPTLVVFVSFDMTDYIDMGQVLQDHNEIYPSDYIPDAFVIMKVHQNIVPSNSFNITNTIMTLHNSERGQKFGQLYFKTEEVVRRGGLLPLTFELD